MKKEDKPYCQEDTYLLCMKNPSFNKLVKEFDLELEYSRQPMESKGVQRMLKLRDKW